MAAEPIETTHRVNPLTLMIVPKAIVIITADHDTLIADGVAEARVTFTGLVAPATALIANQRVAVTPTDNVVTITSDVVADFGVSLLADANHYSENALTVRAR
jgi:hypothetical protein